MIQICQSVGSTLAVALYTMIIGLKGVVDGIHTAFIIAFLFSILAFLSGLPLKKPE